METSKIIAECNLCQSCTVDDAEVIYADAVVNPDDWDSASCIVCKARLEDRPDFELPPIILTGPVIETLKEMFGRFNLC